PRLSALATGILIQQETGQPVVLHVCARDRNYIGLQGDLLGCAALGLNNLLFITGDPPKLGNYTFATGVFDTDSVGLVRLQNSLNHGIDLAQQRIATPTRAVIGVGADPNALDFEREIKHLRNKAAAGADYVATQPIFDPAAFLRFADAIADLNLPIIAGVWPLASLRNALFMKNEVPGVVVPDSIIERMQAAGTQEEQLATGIAIAREMLDAIRHRCAGVQVSAPLGNLDAALKTIL
ncbi:MAG: methylenetetrahydrofolate reductase, partial [Victivallales bacterium]|nr:methylenetetrahydrofolate reductase [Victivallales bacterium]